jgi:hypothetical protein
LFAYYLFQLSSISYCIHYIIPWVVLSKYKPKPPAPPPPAAKLPPPPPPPTIKAKALDALAGIGLFTLGAIDLKLLNPDVKVEYTLVLKIDPEYA